MCLYSVKYFKKCNTTMKQRLKPYCDLYLQTRNLVTKSECETPNNSKAVETVDEKCGTCTNCRLERKKGSTLKRPTYSADPVDPADSADTERLLNRNPKHVKPNIKSSKDSPNKRISNLFLPSPFSYGPPSGRIGNNNKPQENPFGRDLANNEPKNTVVNNENPQTGIVNKGKIKCEYSRCGRMIYLDSYELHLKTHDKFLCKSRKCGRNFENEEELIAHTNDHFLKIYGCEDPECNQRFDDRNKMNEHHDSHGIIINLPWICKTCLKKYESEDGLNNHGIRAKHDSQNEFVCTVQKCERKFPNEEELKSHSNKHSQKVYQCEDFNCQQQFDHRDELIEHHKTHGITQIVHWICKICFKGYEAENGLIKHGYQLNHSTHDRQRSQKEKIQCKHSGCEKYILKGNISTHMKTHNRFICLYPNCNLEFKKEGDLHTHEINHYVMG